MTRMMLCRGLFVALGLAGWAIFAHIYSTTQPGSILDVGLGIFPVAALLLFALWTSAGWLIALLAMMMLALVFLLYADVLSRNVAVLYFGQHLATNLALGTLFLSSLWRSRTPLVTRFALLANGNKLSPAAYRYTRLVTIAWVLFFFGMAAVSGLLFSFASLATWSVFANLLSTPATVAMFLGEIWLRHRVLPEDKNTLLDTIRAYQASRRNA